MSAYSRISNAFKNALVLPLDKGSKYILVSDCHRGRGNANDNFMKNEFLYLAALNYYFKKGFTYLELGDGDELWENRSMKDIKEMHIPSFQIMGEYYRNKRMYCIYGNHDMIKRNSDIFRKHMKTYHCDKRLCELPLCPDIIYYPGIILRDKENIKDIYIIHGHQADLLNSSLWRISRFLVRYVWKPLESIGIPDPTSAAKNNIKKKKSETKLMNWAIANNRILIAGHTHHPMPGSEKSPYFNTGSCVHPTGITAIEIENRCLSLVKWSIQANENMVLYASREVLGDKYCMG